MTDHPGLELLRVEMNRERDDALATLANPGPAAGEIAASIRATGRLILYAMGGSQHVNRIVEPLYRECGIDCRSMIASEQLTAPLPASRRTALISSQSGESGEIKELLATSAEGEERFGLTLEANSTLGRTVRASIVAAGGTEHAFAATRSIVLTLAMHAAMLEALGMPQDALRAALTADLPADIDAVAAAIAGSDAFIFAGAHVMQGAAESAALSMMELVRVPTIGFEGGQFRHGPFECLRPGLAVLILRSAGPDFDRARQLVEVPVAAGCTVVLFDTSGRPGFDGATQVSLPENKGLAAAMSCLLTFQHLNIAMARRLIPKGIGTPRFTSKVTA